MDLPAPVPPAPAARADGQPGRRPLHRREQPDEGRRRARRGRPPARTGTPGLRIVAHDLDDAVERDGRPSSGTSLELVPAYEPDELDDAAGRHRRAASCPSVMRESHSLVTREALLRGVPVVITDTIGPEEVVDDGVNGLVVPAADPDAAGRRAARRSSTRAVLGDLQQGAAAPADGAVASTTQVDGPRRRATTRLVAEPRPAPSTDRRPARVLFVVGIDGAPLRYRAHLPAEALALHGVAQRRPPLPRPRTSPTSPAEPTSSSSTASPPRRRCSTLIDRARGARARRCVFDVDDLIFDPDIADEIPALRLLPPDEAALWLEGVHALPHHPGGLRRLHRFDPAAGRARPTRRGHRRAPVRERRRRRPRRGERHRRCVAPRRPGRSGSATSAAPPPTTTTGATSSAAVAEVLEAHPDAELWLGGPPRARRRRSRPARRSGASAPVHRLAPPARPCCATSTSTWPRSSRAAGSTTPRAPSSGWRPPSSSTPTIASPSAPVPRRHRGRAHRVARRRPGGVGRRCLERALPTTVTSARWSAPGLDAPRSCAGHRTGRATATCRSWPRCAPARATVRHPSSAAAAAFDEPRLPAPTRLEAYPVPIEGSIGWRVRRIPRPTLLRRLRTKAGAVRRSVVDDGAAATLGRAGRAARRVVERPGQGWRSGPRYVSGATARRAPIRRRTRRCRPCHRR